MTRYIGNVPFVGRKKKDAFRCYCENCRQNQVFYWAHPYKRTMISHFFGRIFCLQVGVTKKSIQNCFHTLLVLLRIKKAVEIGECECCQKRKVRCRYCGHIANFDNWEEIYLCPECQKESYMLIDHPQPKPWFWFDDSKSDE